MKCEKTFFGAFLVLQLVACGGGSNPPPANSAPTADAGLDQSVWMLNVASLDGNGVDSDGSIVSYSWAQTAGTNVTLSDSAIANPTFVVPAAAADETLKSPIGDP